MKNHAQAMNALGRLLSLVKKPGSFRARLIGLLFPEINAILEELAGLAQIIQKENEPEKSWLTRRYDELRKDLP